MKEAIIQYEDMPSGGYRATSWEPLVRCKDCVYWNQIDGSVFGRCNVFNKEWHPGSEWYCADGVKKDEIDLQDAPTIPYDMKWNPDCEDCLPEGINDCNECHKRMKGR